MTTEAFTPGPQLFLFPMDKYRSSVQPKDTRLWNDFLKFHKEHPEVYDYFVRLAHEARARGNKRLGAHLLIQLIRWETHQTGSKEKLKVNNNHFPYYARLFMLNNPDFEGFFELREIKE